MDQYWIQKNFHIQPPQGMSTSNVIIWSQIGHKMYNCDDFADFDHYGCKVHPYGTYTISCTDLAEFAIHSLLRSVTGSVLSSLSHINFHGVLSSSSLMDIPTMTDTVVQCGLLSPELMHKQTLDWLRI